MALCVFGSMTATESCQKNYIQSEQVFVAENEILVEVNGTLISVSQINCDDLGLFYWAWTPGKDDAKMDFKKCYNGHRSWCTECNGCRVRLCKGRCICAAWE